MMMWNRFRLWQCAVVLLPLLTGCAHGSHRDATALAALYRLEHAPSYDPAALPDVDVLALGPDAKGFIDKKVGDITDTYEQLRALRRAVFDKDGLKFRYDDALTLTADEAFARRAGNCLALANFFVAAARYLGVDAVYQEVHRRSPAKDAAADNNGLNVVQLHVNVSGAITWHARQVRYVLDYIAVPEEDFDQAHIITDRRALVHYYNNLGMRHLAGGDVESALQYLKKAVLTDPDVDFVWSNLGVVYARRGDLEAAELAYRRALALNGELPSALHNLASLRVGQKDGQDHAEN
jgi:tetratricopeptide (TPR) repeat protein